jgi:predicted DNA-binding transcriptional regulator AlpA
MKELTENSLLRISQVLELIPISRSAWWQGCKSGKYPKPVKIGPRTSAWRYGDIAALLKKIANKLEEEQ